MPIKPIGTPTATPMIVGRCELVVVLASGSVSTASVGVADSLRSELADVTLLIVTVIIEGSPGFVGDTVISDVLILVVGGNGSGFGVELVEVVLVDVVLVDVMLVDVIVLVVRGTSIKF